MISLRDAPATGALTLHTQQLRFLCPPPHIPSLQNNVICNNSTHLGQRAISCCFQQEPDATRLDHVSRTSRVLPSSAVATASSVETQLEEHTENVETPNRKPLDDEKQLSKVWREIQGGNNWKGLLDHPIDPMLRLELIRYGEFAQIAYDAFDYDKHSKYCGSCKYNRKQLLERTDKGDCGYEVTKYLYATSNIELPNFFRRSDLEHDRWSHSSNWIGYIAVATDKKEIERLGRRDIVVAWRGTVTAVEWIDDLLDIQEPAGFDSGEHKLSKVKVESGFLSLYVSSNEKSRYNKVSARQQLQSEIRRLLKEFEGEELSITVTGHSLGGALALLSAYDIAAAHSNVGHGRSASSIPITVFSFSAPRVGNRAFKRRIDELGVKVLRVVNVHDGVPKVPGIILNEGWQWSWFHDLVEGVAWAYYHVGVELKLNCEASPHLKRTPDPACHHNLEAHLHVLDGYHGEGKEFKSVTGRSIVLVNKASNYLVREAYIPPFWWQEMNKGLVKNEKGEWVLSAREEEHLPENHHSP